MKYATIQQIQAHRKVCEKIAQDLPEPYHSAACAILDRPHWLEPWSVLMDAYIRQLEVAQ